MTADNYVYDKRTNEVWVEVVPYEKPKIEPKWCRDHKLPGIWDRESFYTIGSIIHTACCDAHWRMCAIGDFGLVTWEQVVWVEKDPMTTHRADDGEWVPVRSKLGFRVKSR